ncbi:hypothetical protein Mnod_2215 [Methylobacterium nodulans ORS 2060]|uniref:Uncharacterized protein n=1 Tax=Methylobacterium nodulans (strain LMG 21967 / CNCM I-2342 / ORS 2060) TaxID=460265 RepID=B8I9W7_METNO|nr:hypothetical protein Mnod_2215 [Methylobacterium nodulans ORS 2060]
MARPPCLEERHGQRHHDLRSLVDWRTLSARAAATHGLAPGTGCWRSRLVRSAGMDALLAPFSSRDLFAFPGRGVPA